MFRSLSSLVKSRRIRHGSTAIVERRQHQPSSVDPAHETDAAANMLPEWSVVHNVQGEAMMMPEALGNTRQGLMVDNCNSSIFEQELCQEKTDLMVNKSQNREGKQPTISAHGQKKSPGCILGWEIENAASCSHLPSEHGIDTNVVNSMVDSTGPSLLEDRNENSANVQCSAKQSDPKKTSEDTRLLKDITSFQNLNEDRKIRKSSEANLNSGAVQRTISSFSIDSLAEYCRVCQQLGEEPLMELGCHCRGELAKAHRSCIQQWFNNKGTNKCEVCQHVATNLPHPTSQPKQNFWVWRLNRPYGVQRRDDGLGQGANRSIRPVLLLILRRHPSITLLWLFLLIFMTYLFVDVVGSSSVGYAAMAIGFLFGVLVVLGLGTGARLIAECWHERNLRRNIQRLEMPPNVDHIQGGIV